MGDTGEESRDIFSTKIKFATGVMHRLIICISALMPVYSAFDVISMLIKK
jgi:hypothetical protein